MTGIKRHFHFAATMSLLAACSAPQTQSTPESFQTAKTEAHPDVLQINRCSNVVYDERHVLTAAHCVFAGTELEPLNKFSVTFDGHT